MAKKLLTVTDKAKKKAKNQTKKFMSSVRSFIASKNNGEVPPEQECSLMLLETYYSQFIQITEELNAMDSIIISGRYGPQPSPLISAQATMSNRIESMMKELGLTLKASVKMGVKEVKPEETPLEAFIKNKQVEKR